MRFTELTTYFIGHFRNRVYKYSKIACKQPSAFILGFNKIGNVDVMGW